MISKRLKRCVSLLVCFSLCFSSLTYAGTPSVGAPGTSYPPKQSIGNVPNPTYPQDHGGVRITVTNMKQAEEYGIGKLDSAAPYTEVAAQHAKFASLLKSKIWEPGKRGLFICDTDENACGVIENENFNTDWIASTKMLSDGGSITHADNHLAWNVYNPKGKSMRPAGDGSSGESTSYYKDIYNIFIGAEGKQLAAQDALGWARQVRQVYETQNIKGEKNYRALFGKLFGDRNNLVDPFAQFSWASVTPTGDPIYEGNASQHVIWSHIGMASSIMYYIWACEDMSNM